MKTNKRHKITLWVMVLGATLLVLLPELRAGTEYWTNGGGTGLWTTAANWTNALVPGAATDVVIDNGGTVEISTNVQQNINSLTIANGVLTHTFINGTSPEPYKVNLLINNNFQLNYGASINVAQKGYAKQRGPGYTGGTGQAGSHGGIGADDGANSDLAGTVYGDATAPIYAGSGGGAFSSPPAGGVVILNVGGSSIINGVINAESGSGTIHTSAGGSIYIITGSLSGTGYITANAGNVTAARAGGGGGRIAIKLTGADQDFSGFDLSHITAFGGDSIGSTNEAGAAGTIYLENDAMGTGGGNLIISNKNRPLNVESDSTDLNQVPITAIPSASPITVGTVTIRNGAFFKLNSAITAGNVVVEKTGVLYGSGTTGATIGGDLIVRPNSVLRHLYNATSISDIIKMTIGGALQLDAGASINARGRGFMAKSGPGHDATDDVDGSSHGGQGSDAGGGAHDTANDANATTYGNLFAPTTAGSGGDLFGGGGVVELHVSGATVLNGLVDVRGDFSSTGSTSSKGGASGGSFYLSTASITGSGVIVADGGNSFSIWGAGGGGGGRIAVYLTGAGQDFSAFSESQISAYGGKATESTFDSNYKNGGAAGTIYLETNDQGDRAGDFIVKNKNIIYDKDYTMTALPAGCTFLVGNVIVKEHGHLLLSGADPSLQSKNWNVYSSGNLTVNGATTLTGNVHIYAKGHMRHSDNSTTQAYVLDLTISEGDFIVDAGGNVGVSGLGYDPDNGPGAPTAADQGGSYGGIGGDQNSPATKGTTYGNLVYPVDIGSGGEGTGAGGGAVKIIVSNGSAVIDGVIAANGESGTGGAAPGGSGGSIWISCKTISGIGNVETCGGNSDSGAGSGAGGGGGGRIALHLTQAGATFASFSKYYSYGGYSGEGDTDENGAAGTIFLKETNSANGYMILDNKGVLCTYAISSIPDVTPFIYDIFVRGSAVVEPANNGIINCGNMYIESSGLLTSSGGNITGDVYVQSGGKLTHFPNTTTKNFWLDLAIQGNLEIASGGEVNADACGYSAKGGPGAPNGGTFENAGSHGGMGAYNHVGGISYTIANIGNTYGDPTAPGNLGSGGATGKGGGAIKLAVNGNIFLNGGKITANGESISTGAGAGGSVWIIATKIQGSGNIQANGGNSSSHYGGGGGGRVAVLLTDSSSNLDNLIITAYGGHCSQATTRLEDGAAGTVFVKTGSAGVGNLIIDNNNNRPAPEITSRLDAGNFSAYDVTIRNYGRLEPLSGASLDCRDLTISTNGILTSKGGTITGNVIIDSLGQITHFDNSTTESETLVLSIGSSLVLNAGGMIKADALGFDAGSGTGVGSGGGGGSHGGRAGGTTGETYDSITNPVNLGSGGTSASGGGALHLTVHGTTTMAAATAISADGAAATTGAGAGGSVYLSTGGLSGSGDIRALGGAASGGTGNGAGGRVAVIITGSGNNFSTFSGTITAYGGASGGGSYGSAGTVYKETAAQGSGRGSLIVDNNANSAGAGKYAATSGSATETVTVGNIYIQNEGDFVVYGDDVLALTGNNTTMTIGATESFTLYGNLNLGGKAWSIASGTFTPKSGSIVTYTGQTPDVGVTLLNDTDNIDYYDLGVNNASTVFDQNNKITILGNLHVFAGNYYFDALDLSVPNTITIEESGRLKSETTSVANTLTIGTGGLINKGAVVLWGNGQACGQDPDIFNIRSSVSTTQRSWTGYGTFDINDVDIQDQGGTANIKVYSSKNRSNNGANWIFTICPSNVYIPKRDATFGYPAGY